MFGRIFAISPGVRAHFAPGRCAFARRGASANTAPRRARFNTSESGLLAPLSFLSLLSIAGARTQILEIVENTCTNEISDRRPTDRRAQRGEENLGVGPPDRPTLPEAGRGLRPESDNPTDRPSPRPGRVPTLSRSSIRLYRYVLPFYR